MKFGETFKPVVEKIQKLTKMGAFLVALGLTPESKGQTVTKVDLGDGTEVSGDVNTLGFVENFTDLAQENSQKISLLNEQFRQLQTQYAKDSVEYTHACQEIVSYIGQAQEFFETTKSRERSEALLSQFSLKKAEEEMSEFFSLYEQTQQGAQVSPQKLTSLFKTYILQTSGIENLEQAFETIRTSYKEGRNLSQKKEKKALRGKGASAADDGSPSAPEWIQPETLDDLITAYFTLLFAQEKIEGIDIDRDNLESNLNWLKGVFRDAGLEITEKDIRMAETR